MIRVKTFTTQLKAFHTMNEIEGLDRAVNGFIASAGIRTVVSVSDAVTTGPGGETIGIVRTVAYDDVRADARARYQKRAEEALGKLSRDIGTLAAKAEKLGEEARATLSSRVKELSDQREAAGRRIAELASSGGEAWDELRAGADAALADLGKGVRGALARIRRK